MIQNLNQIENLYVSINKEEILYNNESYKSKDLWGAYVSNLKENSIDIRFLNLLKSNIVSDKKVNFNVCKNLNDNCDLKYLTQTDIRDLLEGKLNLAKAYAAGIEIPKVIMVTITPTIRL